MAGAGGRFLRYCARGDTPFTPTLTGLGERVHLARPEVGLNAHVDAVVTLLTHEDLHDVILVGNSSGGVVITGVAARVPERIGHLVYLDAFVPGGRAVHAGHHPA